MVVGKARSVRGDLAAVYVDALSADPSTFFRA